MQWSQALRRVLVMRSFSSSAAEPGKGADNPGMQHAATASKGSSWRQWRPWPCGLMLLNTRRMRRPSVGVAGKLST